MFLSKVCTKANMLRCFSLNPCLATKEVLDATLRFNGLFLPNTKQTPLLSRATLEAWCQNEINPQLRASNTQPKTFQRPNRVEFCAKAHTSMFRMLRWTSSMVNKIEAAGTTHVLTHRFTRFRHQLSKLTSYSHGLHARCEWWQHNCAFGSPLFSRTHVAGIGREYHKRFMPVFKAAAINKLNNESGFFFAGSLGENFSFTSNPDGRLVVFKVSLFRVFFSCC